jgi:hypothetical protein
MNIQHIPQIKHTDSGISFTLGLREGEEMAMKLLRIGWYY